jgi:hypothetical protein
MANRCAARGRTALAAARITAGLAALVSALGGPVRADPGSAAPPDRPVRIDAAAPEVHAAASPTLVRLGGHFTLYITATFGPGVEVNLREPLALGAAFEVRRRLSDDRRRVDGRTTREWQLDVMPWELGELQVAPIAVTFTALGRAGQVQTNPVPMKIVGDLGDVVDDPKAMRGPARPVGLTARDWWWIWLASASAGAVGIAGIALWLYRRRRRTLRLVGRAIARPARVDMTGERALERLLAIEHSGVLERDAERKIGYAEMVEVIREYLAQRYRIAVHDRSSSELIERLSAAAADGEVAVVESWLGSCDLVKYGGQRATAAEAGKVLDDARALIVTTSQSHPVPRAPGADQEAA